MNFTLTRNIIRIFARGSSAPYFFQKLDHIESTCIIILYFFAISFLKSAMY